MSKIPAELQTKWKFVSTKPYAAQCKWMLNGFWNKLEKEAESIWMWSQKFVELDQDKRHDGCDLDEFWSHKFLETLGQTMTVLTTTHSEIDADFNKRMSMIEYLAYKYAIKVPDIVNAPQGENKEELAKAQAMVDAAQKAVQEMTAKLEAAKQAVAASKVAAAEATKTAEAAWYAAQEQKKALEELQAQEKAFEDKKAGLKAIKDDAGAGVVRRNKAANELEQLMAEDPLPLRKAKINQAAAVKKSERASAAAAEAKARAEQRAAEAEKAQRESEAAVADAEKKMQEAAAFLERVKMAGGVAQGDIWWMQRELAEKKRFLPASKRTQ